MPIVIIIQHRPKEGVLVIRVASEHAVADANADNNPGWIWAVSVRDMALDLHQSQGQSAFRSRGGRCSQLPNDKVCMPAVCGCGLRPHQTREMHQVVGLGW